MDSLERRYLSDLRRELHRAAEPSGGERGTAARLLGELETLAPDVLVQGLGGHGLAAAFKGGGAGPTVLLRADMDALPIDEAMALPHASSTSGVAHKCGHDGHMAIAVGVARCIARERPQRGRLVVFFQPSEETGEGAAAVIADPAFAAVRPEVAFALHNLPGFELGRVVVRPGAFACASRGLTIELAGATAHAAEPQRGRSPALAVAQIVAAWTGARQLFTGLDEFAQATVIHAAVGRPAFGTSPGDGRVMATLRAVSDGVIDALEVKLRLVAERIAAAYELDWRFSVDEPFPATVNDPEVVRAIVETARALNFKVAEPEGPFAWSEDFGHFGGICPSALVGLGAGKEVPALHHPAYDFPDALIPYGVALLEAAVRRWLDRRG